MWTIVWGPEISTDHTESLVIVKPYTPIKCPMAGCVFQMCSTLKQNKTKQKNSGFTSKNLKATDCIIKAYASSVL